MTRAQLRILSILREKGEEFRAYAASRSLTYGEAEKAFKEYADECVTAIQILKDTYEE